MTSYIPIASQTLASSAASDQCVMFEGYIDKRTGYGVKRFQNKLYKAHRLAWILVHGEVADKLHIDHICHNEALAKGECEGGPCKHRACTNINHLRAVSASENFLAGKNGLRNRTECKNGHLIEEVGIWESGGIRQCAKCRRDSTIKAKRAFRQRQKESK